MRIKSQLVTLVSGVVVPLVLLAAFLTYQLWQQQHQGYQQQFLERASAVRLALDTELDVTSRTLRAIGDSTEIPANDVEVLLRRRFRRLLDNYPGWLAVALTDARGQVIMTDRRIGTDVPPLLDAKDILRTMSSESAFISNLVTTPDGRHVVYVATAITRKDKAQGVIYAVIDHSQWLGLLRAYPVSKRGTLTLMDRNGIVISRTLKDQQWAGKKAPPNYWAKVIGKDSGAFRAISLDGDLFYAAFSRSQTSGWVLSTGVPAQEVDEALYRHTLVVLLVAVTAILGALAAAWRIGRDINASLHGLLESAKALANQLPTPQSVLPNREARAVRKALLNAYQQLVERDESLRESLEREAAARQQAEQSGRAKDQFLAMMGHELRNPLSTITAAVDLLGTATVPQPVLSRTRDIVRRQARHLTTMINDLMDVAQLDSGEIVLRKSHLDLAQVAAKVLLRFEETGRCAHLQMRTEHAPAWIEADEARIELLISCLLDNACKYTPAGGTVTLEVMGGTNTSVLRIRDTGVGIAAELAERMFDAFAQGDRGVERAEGGLGLGLTLVRKLVHLHGGSIEAYSDGAGRGATFAVTFPTAEMPSPEAEDPGLAVPRDLLLTIVEDIADNRDMMVMLLEAQGRRIKVAADGPSGVEVILEGPSDIAIVDIGLPGFDGLEVARRVRQAPGGAKVLMIALTGFGTEADRVSAFAAGFDDFLVKPFDPETFEVTLSEGLAAKRMSASTLRS